MIKIKKFIMMLVFMIFSAFTYSSSYDLGDKALADKLYSAKGTGTYKAYLEIKGFEENNLIKVFYKETGYKWEYKYTDSRNLNQKQIIPIKINNVVTKKTRKDWYAVLESSVDRSEAGTESRALASKTYGTLYDEWMKGYDLKKLAEYIANTYREKIYPKAKEKYTKFWIESDWYDENDLKYNDIIFDRSSAGAHPIPVLINSFGRELYLLPSFSSSFTKEKEIDGIIFKKVNDKFLIKRKSLEDKKLILTKDEVKKYNLLSDADKDKVMAAEKAKDSAWVAKQEQLKADKAEKERVAKLQEADTLKREWVSESNLSYIRVPSTNTEAMGFYKNTSVNSDELIYAMPGFDYAFRDATFNGALRIFNGVLVKNVEGKLYFNIQNLKDNGIWRDEVSVIQEKAKFAKEWVKSSELKYVVFSGNGFYTGAKVEPKYLAYSVPSYNPNFLDKSQSGKLKIYDGIMMRNVDGVLYFNLENLKEKKLLQSAVFGEIMGEAGTLLDKTTNEDSKGSKTSNFLKDLLK